MITKTRQLLKQKLSPQAYRNIDFLWWTGRHYLPSVGISFFTRRSPTVQGFPSNQASELVKQLRDINTVAFTKMCHAMVWNGSDKSVGRHNYTTVYSALFGKLQNRQIRIFELGLGSGNPNLPFYMGANARPGASLRGWRELFQNAMIFGADLDRDILFKEDRIMTFYCDQLDKNAIRDLWAQPDLREDFDIIIDDGHHTFEANFLFLDGSLDHLRTGGIYVVEDIHKDALGEWRNLLMAYPDRFPDHEFALVELPYSRNQEDNNLLIIRKHT